MWVFRPYLEDSSCCYIFYFFRKYERNKEVIAGFKKNEDILKSRVAEDASKLKKSEQRFEALRKHAEEKLTE